MAESSIEWTDYTFNPWRGCAKVAGNPGCAHCYAEVNYSVKMHGIKWGEEHQGGTRVVPANGAYRQLSRWNAKAKVAGEPAIVFSDSLCDLFEDWQGAMLSHDAQRILWCHECFVYFRAGDCNGCCTFCKSNWSTVPATAEHIRRFFFCHVDAMPWLRFLVLTKRPENVANLWPTVIREGGPTAERYRGNVWLGTSFSDQTSCERWLPELLKLRDLAPVLFASVEPLVGPVDLSTWLKCRCGEPPLEEGEHCEGCLMGPPHWIIVGGESGPQARPCNIQWVRDLVGQCQAADVPCFVKQLGSNVTDEPELLGEHDDRDKYALCYSHPKGGDPSEWPEDLRVRQFPQST